MNCRFNWYINMKVRIELYTPDYNDTIFKTYKLEDTNNFHSVIKKLYSEHIWDWRVISITFYNIAQLPNSIIVYKDFTFQGWDAKTVILYTNGKEIVLHEPLCK